MDKVTCNELWREWMLSDPENEMVLLYKEKMSTYSKQDWENMADEATLLTNRLGELVLYNIPIESKLAEDGFDSLMKHFDDWFVKINKDYAKKFAFACHAHSGWVLFFDGFHPGLSKYISKICFRYLEKLPD